MPEAEPSRRFGVAAGVGVVDGVVFDLVEHGVGDGGEVHRQPEQARGSVLWGEGGDPGDPVLLPERGDGAHRGHVYRDRGREGERRGARGLREDGVYGCSVQLRGWVYLGPPECANTPAARLSSGPSRSAGGGVSPPGWWGVRDCARSGRRGSGLRWCRRGAGSGSSRAGGCTPRGDTCRARPGL